MLGRKRSGTFTLDKRVELFDQEEGGTILFDRRSGQYFQLNALAVQVMRGLLAGRGIPELVDEIAADFGCPLEQVQLDVGAFLDELKEAGVLR